ncbi:hypothetical protein HELRODRAFT_164821 [Helobdella robusta]|uniref:Uncharacterized protein n=1 Tax=Helobdella robusta TaxID=6412 RepID=T1EVU7_HELRO|nr:hypothetical protein HELRODRAFT_164821 [Helobdella robusta]ESN92724.1 hypothetical protein HELRODRAFT_164821 [Helobdella robusta]
MFCHPQSKQVQLPRAWYPQQYNNKASRFNKPSVSTSSFSSQSLSPKTAKIIIGVLGAVAGASILGVILTAVLVTQLNKPNTTQAPPGTTVDQGTATRPPTTAAVTTAVALTTARPPVVMPVVPDPDPLNPPVQQGAMWHIFVES